MKKKEYMKPVMCTVELQHRQRIMAGSFVGIQTTSSDNDGPVYDDAGSDDIWDAN